MWTLPHNWSLVSGSGRMYAAVAPCRVRRSRRQKNSKSVGGARLSKNLEATMPFFKGDFTAEQLEVMRRAASECALVLGVQGDVPKERDIAIAILEAANSGCWKHGDLVAIGLATARQQMH